MLTQQQVDAFHERGFLMGPKVLTDDEADDLRARLDALLEDPHSEKGAELKRNLTGREDAVVYQVVNIWQADEAFRRHLYNPEICAMVAQLTGDPILRVWHDQIQYKPPRVGGPTDWHQDHPYWPIIQPPDLVSAWLALDDATVDNGCMRMVPRSHTWGSYKDGTIGTREADFAPAPDDGFVPEGETIEIVPCECAKGQVMFHHCLTWHGSPPNRSERGRPAIAVHYMPGYTRYEPTGEHVMQRHVNVEPGEVLQGDRFPTVWNGGPVVTA